MEYKTFKLKSGELLACGMEASLGQQELERRRFIEVHRPVVFSNFKCMDPDGQIVETISMAPYMGIASNSSLPICTDSIVSWGDLKDQARSRYLQFLSHLDSPDSDYDDLGDDPDDDDLGGDTFNPDYTKMH